MIILKNEEPFSDWVELGESRFLIQTPSKERKIMLADSIKYQTDLSSDSLYDKVKLARLIFRCYVKDWEKFMVDGEGEEIKCKLDGDWICETQFQDLCLVADEIMGAISGKILEKVNLIETNKKK